MNLASSSNRLRSEEIQSTIISRSSFRQLIDKVACITNRGKQRGTTTDTGYLLFFTLL